MNQDQIQKASVLNHIAAWKSGRLEASDITITHHGSPWKVFVWTFRDRTVTEHLVIHINGNVFVRFEVVTGELGEVIESVERQFRSFGCANDQAQPEQREFLLAAG